jgi:hypothetical protein
MGVLNARKHKRLGREIPVSWSIDAQQVSGDGLLMDVSLTGACLRLEHPLDGWTGAIFTLHADGVECLPRTARLRWFRRLGGPIPVYLCGLIFHEQGLHAKTWRDWLDAELAEESRATPLPRASTANRR